MSSSDHALSCLIILARDLMLTQDSDFDLELSDFTGLYYV